MQAGNSNSAAPRTITSFLPALLAQLIPNTTATHAITYTNTYIHDKFYKRGIIRHLFFVKFSSGLPGCLPAYLLGDFTKVYGSALFTLQ